MGTPPASLATGTLEALGAALASAFEEAEAPGVVLDWELHAALRSKTETSDALALPIPTARERRAMRGWIEAVVVIDSSSFVMRPPGVAQHNAVHRNSRAPRPRGRASRYRRQVSVGALLPLLSLPSLLPPSAGCSRHSESVPGPAETRPQPSVAPRIPVVPEVERERVFSVGQQATGAGYLLAVKRVLECSGQEGWRPEPGRLFLGVELDAAARDESIAIGYSHVKLRYGERHTLAPKPFVKTDDCEPLLKYTRLAPGQSVVGWVVFSIPESASSLELQVRPRQFLNDRATLVDLGR